MQRAIELIEELKSLRLKNAPGRHDQKSHGKLFGRLSTTGTRVTREWLLDQSRLWGELYLREKDAIARALVASGTTQEDLENLEGFSIKAPEGYVYDKDGYFTPKNKRARKLNEIEGAVVLGVCTKKPPIIHISSAVIDGYYQKGVWELNKTVAHEMGHHLVFTMEMTKQTDALLAAGRVMRNLRGKNEEQLMKYGLRPYSLTNNSELLADTYKTLRVSQDVHIAALEELWQSEGVKDLESVFKELEPIVSVYELRSRERDGNVEIYRIKTSVPANALTEIPQYYVPVS